MELTDDELNKKIQQAVMNLAQQNRMPVPTYGTQINIYSGWISCPCPCPTPPPPPPEEMELLQKIKDITNKSWDEIFMEWAERIRDTRAKTIRNWMQEVRPNDR